MFTHLENLDPSPFQGFYSNIHFLNQYQYDKYFDSETKKHQFLSVSVGNGAKCI